MSPYDAAMPERQMSLPLRAIAGIESAQGQYANRTYRRCATDERRIPNVSSRAAGFSLRGHGPPSAGPRGLKPAAQVGARLVKHGPSGWRNASGVYDYAGKHVIRL